MAGAGLDVFPDEPNIHPKLLSYKNCIILPHMGTETKDTQYKMELQVLENLKMGLRGETLPDLVKECS